MSQADEFLGLLSEEDRAELERIGHRRQADRPDVLLARGDEADRVLVLEAGRVKVTKTEPPPARQRGIMVKDANELFAELSKRGLV